MNVHTRTVPPHFFTLELVVLHTLTVHEQFNMQDVPIHTRTNALLPCALEFRTMQSAPSRSPMPDLCITCNLFNITRTLLAIVNMQ